MQDENLKQIDSFRQKKFYIFLKRKSYPFPQRYRELETVVSKPDSQSTRSLCGGEDSLITSYLRSIHWAMKDLRLIIVDKYNRRQHSRRAALITEIRSSLSHQGAPQASSTQIKSI